MAAQQKPSKPLSLSWMWLGENHKALAKEAGSANGWVVAKFAGEKWKTLSAQAKAPYEKKAEEEKAAYAKAMEEYKSSLPAGKPAALPEAEVQDKAKKLGYARQMKSLATNDKVKASPAEILGALEQA